MEEKYKHKIITIPNVLSFFRLLLIPVIVWLYIVKEFYINYSKEATLGQELRIRGFREENTYRMEGVGPASTCFTALCVY